MPQKMTINIDWIGVSCIQKSRLVCIPVQLSVCSDIDFVVGGETCLAAVYNFEYVRVPYRHGLRGIYGCS